VDIRRRVIFSGFIILLGTSAHAASFDCEKAATSAEKIVCGNRALSDLDSKLEDAYKAANIAASPAKQSVLLREQQDWIKYVRYGCGDAACMIIAYDARIDELTSLAAGKADEPQNIKNSALIFKDIQLGQILDEKKAREVFEGFACRDKNLNKSLSSIEHRAVVTCTGKVNFEGQEMDALIELHSGRRLANILLAYDTPYPEEGVISTSVSEMENRLIATYGQPSILRTESLHQPVQYDSKDLIENDDPRDQGGDQWAFADGASINLEPGIGYQKEQGGHIFSKESIWFETGPHGVLVTLPARHAIPVVITNVSPTSGSATLWKSNELMSVMFYEGGKRTCTVGPLVPSSGGNNETEYISTVTCTDFITVGDSVESPEFTMISIVRDGRELASGYVPISKAVAGLERH
jgi:uncharacterized protein YecT (DUF1311 family)